VLSKLGEGGMGEVYLCETDGGQQAAVKRIHPAWIKHPGFVERFKQEVAAARRISGLYTAPVVDYDIETAEPWLATLYIKAPSLAALVRERGPLDPAGVRRLATGLAEGLRAIHSAGLVHRDIKPSNVLMPDDGPRIIDFGIARMPGSSLTRTGVAMGTPSYMSPEQAAGRRVGPPSDVFSLGAVICYAACGASPWGSEITDMVLYRVAHDPPGLPPGLAPDVRAIVSGCLEKSPADRPTPEKILAVLGGRDHAADASGPATAARSRPVVVPEDDAERNTLSVRPGLEQRPVTGVAVSGKRASAVSSMPPFPPAPGRELEWRLVADPALSLRAPTDAKHMVLGAMVIASASAAVIVGLLFGNALVGVLVAILVFGLLSLFPLFMYLNRDR
jgi:serine/threonine protein kinase